MSSAIWRTVLGPRDHNTERIASSASVGLRRSAFIDRIIYDTLRSCQYEDFRRTAARVRLPVTLAVVRNMSGMVSTASRMPMPSIGRLAAASTGTIAITLPPGTPGTANELRMVVNTTDASCAGDRVAPYSFARNSTPTGIATAAPTRKTDPASGSTNPVTIAGIFALSPLPTIAGSAASDDGDANATACAGAQNATNAFAVMPPAAMPTGYSSTATARTVSSTTTTMYAMTAPAAPSPSFDASGTASAKTPNGASSRIPDTSRCIASATPCVSRSTASRRSACTPASATPNSTENTISGSIAPSAADLITLGDTRSTNHCAIPGVPAGVTAAGAADGPSARLGAGPRSASAALWSI